MECIYRHIHLTHFTQCTVGKSVGHSPGSNQPVVSVYSTGLVLLSFPFPSRVCVPLREINQWGGVDLSADGSDERKRTKQQNGKGKKRRLKQNKKDIFLCVWESFIYERQCCRWKHWSQYDWKTMAAYIDERKRFSSLLFLFLFFFFCLSPCCPSLWLLMDGGLSGSGWLSLVSTWVCVWCSTKRTQTKVSVATRFHLIGWYSRSLFLFCFVCFFSFLLISSLFFSWKLPKKI